MADYKNTVFLPKTDFPMKAGLAKKEPELLARWQQLDLYRRLREDSKGREKFVLHDGPPYANGHLHIGHALNKILKDVVNRSQQMLGKDANYVPGWDCHGLPIEWKIEDEYRAAGKDKDAVPIVEFRKQCRDFAQRWIDVQREEFKRLGVVGDWDNPYTTMAYSAEAQIVRELGKFLMNGGLFKGSKAVLWSVVEKTALAEAEVAYHDHVSDTIWVGFPIVKAKNDKLKGVRIVIWTTTPWTMPGNRAIARHPEAEYALVELQSFKEGSFAQPGLYLVAKDLAEKFAADVGATAFEVKGAVTAAELEGVVAAHPLRGQGYDFDVPLLTADFVTMDAGTGFVHIAPGHGADDYELGVKNRIEVPHTVDADGTYYDHVPLFAGKRVLTPYGKRGNANDAVIEALKPTGYLLATSKLQHSYPHSWRSKAPLIFRNAPQWFIAMDKPIDGIQGTLRQTALQAIADTRFVPEAGQTRLGGMIENRPDWCVSRQRAWGVPIAVFVNKKTNEPLRDPAVMERIAKAFEEQGADAWFEGDQRRFLGNDYDPNDYEAVTDILDVWFDSGCTHTFVLENNPDLKWPASLYLEGSDQHRGYFHSSLLESCGTRGRAPYDAVLTHGFTLDEQGRKMSKSLGNVTAPQEVWNEYGADILRLWVVGTDYVQDQRIGKEILKQHGDAYRRLRNTLRYLLGNLEGFNDAEKVAVGELPSLEKWVLHRLSELDAVVRQSIHDFDFYSMSTALHNFCAGDLSAFYFDIRKDLLYCDEPSSLRRRACRTVLAEVFSCLTAWLAPFICFTAEEAWLARPNAGKDGQPESVHLRIIPDVPTAWRDDDSAERWKLIRNLRKVVTGALEIERAEKRIGSSLQAMPTVYAPAEYVAAFAGLDPAEIFITSGAKLVAGEPPAGSFTSTEVAGVGVAPKAAEGTKCQRCWMVLPEVGQSAAHPGLCRRCEDAVGKLGGDRAA